MKNLRLRISRLEGRAHDRREGVFIGVVNPETGAFLKGFTRGRWVAGEDLNPALQETMRGRRHPCKLYAGFDPEAV